MHEAHFPAHLRDTEEYIIAHMLPSEARELSELQGGSLKDPATGYHSFLPLGEILGNQHVKPHFEMFKREQMGKNINRSGLEEQIRKSGRYGDTEAVILPRPLADLFDHALYGGRQPGNPHTGKREYFLGGLLSSLAGAFSPIMKTIGGALSPMISTIGSAISPVVNSLAPAIGGLAKGGLSALGSMVGMPEVGGALGDALGGTVSGVLNDMTGGGGQQAQQQPQQQLPANVQGGIYNPAALQQQQQQLQNTPYQGGSALDLLKYGAGQVLNRSLPQLSQMANQGIAQGAGQYLPQGMANQMGGLTQHLMNHLGGMTAGSMIQGREMPSMSSLGSNAVNQSLGYGQAQVPNIQNPLYRAGAQGMLNTAQNMMKGQNIGSAFDQGVGGISPQNMTAAQHYATGRISDLLNSVMGGGQQQQQQMPQEMQQIPQQQQIQYQPHMNYAMAG